MSCDYLSIIAVARYIDRTILVPILKIISPTDDNPYANTCPSRNAGSFPTGETGESAFGWAMADEKTGGKDCGF